MTTTALVESKSSIVSLTPVQYEELTRLSTSLAGNSAWWGAADVGPTDKQIVSLTRISGDHYRLTVRNAVGAIGLPGHTLVVHPKIPFAHFAYIAAMALAPSPRVDKARTLLAAGVSLHDLVARWLLVALRELMRSGLARGYSETEQWLGTVRGSIDTPRSVQALLRGDMRVLSRYEEFSVDAPANRVLKAACVALARSRLLRPENSREAAFLLQRLRGIGPLQPSDVRVAGMVGDKRYEMPLDLATQVLAGTARALSEGTDRGETFLFYTPPIIESGIRNCLEQRLAPIRVQKRGRVLSPTLLRVTPDLELGPHPLTGDVKYRVSDGTWDRGELAQAVFFATAFNSPIGLIVGFRASDVPAPMNLQVGAIKVRSFLWDATPEAEPAVSAEALASYVRELTASGAAQAIAS